jgi:hypothetical protein
MATTTLNTPRTEMRASKWNRALTATCLRVVAVDAILPVNRTSNVLAARSVR